MKAKKAPKAKAAGKVKPKKAKAVKAKAAAPKRGGPAKTVKVDFLARVEGEGGILIKLKGNEVDDVRMTIFEPPRFFEAFLRGRRYSEAPDITARICGICPVAYQMSSVHAMEHAFGITVDGQLRALRRLLYCGEWIESHVLHVYMLHAPDFLGYQDVLGIAKDNPDLVVQALRMKKLGNDLMTTIGGREIHPINVRVGGFYKVPRKADLLAYTNELKWCRDKAVETAKLVAGLNFPDFEQDYEFVCLRHPDEYPLCDGRLVSNKGLDIDLSDYDLYFMEEHVQHSNALHSIHRGRSGYHVGPLARFNLNYDRLTPLAQETAAAIKLAAPVTNPFKSIIVRAIETIFAAEEALRIIEAYEEPDTPAVPVHPKSAIGYGASEAPRGTLIHRYKLDDKGIILDAKIVPPTAQNLKTIENDLRAYAAPRAKMPLDKLTWECEQAVRNYDPCISCATHMVTVTRE